MKSLILDRNGMVKPLGLVLIVILLAVTCCAEYICAQPLNSIEPVVTLKGSNSLMIAEEPLVAIRVRNPEVEIDFAIEEWMVNQVYWLRQEIDNSRLFKPEEEELEFPIEKWMLDFRIGSEGELPVMREKKSPGMDETGNLDQIPEKKVMGKDTRIGYMPGPIGNNSILKLIMDL